MCEFESSVNSDSIQTKKSCVVSPLVFESSVNSDSIQTYAFLSVFCACLRVV